MLIKVEINFRKNKVGGLRKTFLLARKFYFTHLSLRVFKFTSKTSVLFGVAG